MKNCRTSESLAIIILMTYSPLLFLAVTIAWTLLMLLDSPTFVHDKIDEDSFEGWLMKQNNLKLKIKEGPWASSKDRCVYFEMYYINFSV